LHVPALSFSFFGIINLSAAVHWGCRTAAALADEDSLVADRRSRQLLQGPFSVETEWNLKAFSNPTKDSVGGW